MPIKDLTIGQTGLVGVQPSIIYIDTDDTYATVTTTGYLNQAKKEGYAFNNKQLAEVYTTDEGPVILKVAVTSGNVSLVQLSSPGDVVLPTIANHVIVSTDTAGTLGNLTGTAINAGSLQAGLSGTAGSLLSFPATAAKGSLALTAVANTGNTATVISNVAMGQASTVSIPDPGNAAARFLIGATATPFVSGNFPVASGTGGLMVDSGKSAASLPTFTSPTIANHLAVFTNTAGNLGEDAATAINGGNIQAGLSGTAGTLASFPATAANGSLILAAINAGGAFNTTISNSAMAQSTVYSIPDVSAATGQFLVKTAALVSGNLIQASGTGGVTIDSGIATSNVQLKTQIKAQQVTGLGGAGAGPITVTATGVTASSVICVSILDSSNPVSVIKVSPGTNNFALTVSADPGATLSISYIAFIAAQ